MSILITKKSEYQTLLPNKGIIPTIDALKEFLLLDSKVYKRLLLIESHFKAVRRRQQIGVLSFENLSIEENLIRERLLDLIIDTEWNETTLSILVDPRDNQTYKTIELNGAIWMAENLNYEIEGSKTYNDERLNIKEFGRLYTWEMAKAACPPNWKLASMFELISIVKENGDEHAYNLLINGGDSGFNANLGGAFGSITSEAPSYFGKNQLGLYWLEESYSDDAPFQLRFIEKKASFGMNKKDFFSSCRCFRHLEPDDKTKIIVFS